MTLICVLYSYLTYLHWSMFHFFLLFENEYTNNVSSYTVTGLWIKVVRETLRLDSHFSVSVFYIVHRKPLKIFNDICNLLWSKSILARTLNL